MSPIAIIIIVLVAAGLTYIVGLVVGIQEGMRVERVRIRGNIITDQASGAGDYAEAVVYADKIVRP